MTPIESTADALSRHVSDLRERGDHDALRVLERQAARLVVGNRQYGKLDAIGDRRKWLDELREELLDAVVYMECEAMRTEARPDAIRIIENTDDRIARMAADPSLYGPAVRR